MRVIKWAALVGVALLVAFIFAIGSVYAISQRMFTQHIDVSVPSTPDLRHGDIRRGQHLVLAVLGCRDCHGANMGGKLFFSDPALGVMYTPNLTRGVGGVGATYADADWIRALRHGVRRDGTPLLIMPSRDFAELTRADLAATVTYILSLPPVRNTTPPAKVGLLGRALFATRQLPIAADTILHDNPQPSTVQPAVTVAYGRYLVRAAGCMSCHGVHFSGGHLEGAPSDPPAQNLTPAGDLGHWTFAQFTQTLRTGTRPDGTHLNAFMPWPDIAQMTDDELLAIYKLLKTVPPRETGKG
jgi:mono/diheme cytochrome c family protein